MNSKIYRLDTPNTSLVFMQDEDKIYYLYYGKKIGDVPPEICYVKWDNIGTDLKNKLFSCFGDDDHRDKSILLFNPDNSFSNEFVFKNAVVTKGKKAIPDLPSSFGAEKTITFEFVDELENLLLTISYSSYRDTDVITARSSLTNLGEKSLSIKKFASVQLDISESDFTVSTFDGGWASERYRHDTKLNSGLFLNQSLAGASSSQHNPFSLIKNQNGVYAFNLVYSGNHKTSYETDSYNRTRIICGVNDFAFEYRLAGGDTFYTPEAVIIFSKNEDDLTLNLHSFVNKHIIPKRRQNKKRPVVINNWEGTGFDFTREKILEIAKKGKKIGAEMFVLDDGWFGKRNDDRSSLGDWFDNVEKTGGISRLADDIRALGLDFGIWLEPEMISPDSELFRAHPEYAMVIPGKKPYLRRFQMMLDLTNEEVKNFVIESVERTIELAKPSYIKWDFNRVMSDCFSKSVFIGEYCYRYVVALYSIMKTLTENHPEILFEGCAAGGARFDLGILCYFPQIWTSDNTDPSVRAVIQTNTSICYPQSCMTAHLSASPNGFTKREFSLENRFNVACLFNFGYELDCSGYTDKEVKDAAKLSEFYKKRRDFILYGDFYRLGDYSSAAHGLALNAAMQNPTSDGLPTGVCGFQVVSARKDKSLASVIMPTRENGVSNRKIAFKGLDKNEKYTATVYDKNLNVFDSFFIGGDVLSEGIPYEKYRLAEEICSDADFRSFLIEFFL